MKNKYSNNLTKEHKKGLMQQLFPIREVHK